MTAQKMAIEPRRVQPKVWGQKSKIDEELDYFTELALHESERWIQVQLLQTSLDFTFVINHATHKTQSSKLKTCKHNR